MKKLIFGLVAILVTINLANAWSIEKKIKSGHNQYDVTVICDNGLATTITENTYTKNYYVNGGMYQNFNSAVTKACSPNNTKKQHFINKGTVIFKKQKGIDGIEALLLTQRRFNLTKVSAELGGDKNTFLNNARARIKVIKCFPKKEVIVDEYYNNKNSDPKRFEKLKEGKYIKLHSIDSYCKIWDGSNYYYVRKQAIK